MRTVTNIAAAAAALLIAASLAGCQLITDTVGDQPSLGSISDQGAPASGADASQPVTFIRVVDGDTIAVAPTDALPATNDSGTEHVVRLLGIDTPEMNKMSEEAPECGAEAATAQLEALVGQNSSLSLVFDAQADQTDRYGRSLAYVQLPDGTDLALNMAAGGFAEAWYPSGEPEPERFGSYAAAEDSAAASGAGSHATCDTIGR